MWAKGDGLGNISIKERKRPIPVEVQEPGGKLAQGILAALDPAVDMHMLALPPDEASGAFECLLIEGSVNGQGHRVLVEGIVGFAKGSTERLHRLARYKKSLSAEAGFCCMGEGTPGEVLLLCFKLGLIPVEYDSERSMLRIHLGTATIVRHVSIQSWRLSLFASPKDKIGQGFDEKSGDLFFQGKPMRNWLSRESRKLMQKVKQDCALTAAYHLQKPSVFDFQGRSVPADRFEAFFECRIHYRVHSLQADLADLEYNPRLRKMLWSGDVPRERKELARLPGMIQDEAHILAKDTASKPELHVYQPVTAASVPGFPDLNPHILSTTVGIRNS